MRVLTIDTSTRIGTVSAVDGEQVLCALESTEQTRHAERLLDLVKDVLEAAAWTLRDVELLACGMGPGSFTGVRVAMATAKGLCAAASLPLVGVVTLAAMAHAARTSAGPGPMAPLLDAKKGEVFAAAYDAAGELLAEPVHVPVASAQAWVAALLSRAPELQVCGEIAATLDLGAVPVIRNPLCDLPCASAIAAVAQEAWSRSPCSQLHVLEPLYVRPPDIHLPKGRQ
jgi:tRNA threonylcarbamoyladenosine biosynthesis protein TsaB